MLWTPTIVVLSQDTSLEACKCSLKFVTAIINYSGILLYIRVAQNIRTELAARCFFQLGERNERLQSTSKESLYLITLLLNL